MHSSWDSRSTPLYGATIALVTVLVLGCAGDEAPGRNAARPRSDAPRAESPAIVFLGTSLTAGYGLERDQAFPQLIQSKIDSAGLGYRVANAGVSGETSAGARRRVDWVLRQPVGILVIETGANDGLRGQDPRQLAANIQAIIDRAREHDPPPMIILLGMEAPPNLGRDYTRRFRVVYRELAERNGVILVPFLLDGVAGVDSLNQPDGIHPTARGQEIIAGTVWRVLEPLLGRGGAGGK